VDAVPVVAFGTLDDPLAGDEILGRFSLAAPVEFEVVAFEEVFIPVEGIVLELTDDPIDVDLVDPVDPAFQQHKSQEHQHD
jgi:hypothetical protein